jgi:hypothetical protein
VVDASGPALASPPPAAVAEPEEEEPADEDEGDEDVDASADDEPVATQTITLPGRAARPTTLADLSEPEDEAEPGAEQLAVEEPVMEDEPVAEEPVVEPVPVAPVAEEPAVEIQSAVEIEAEELPPVSSPTLEELAQDVAAARAETEGEDMPEDDEPINVKSVETVSAIDLVMGGAEESAADAGSDSAHDDEGPAPA